ncbi:hypothetical protein NHQ30_007455 [Ciborinia camelliae]|nr:hypothetical protein NHQ30_007455 [Ciborinia camelliae]
MDKVDDVSALLKCELLGKSIPEYAILSHTWGADTDEVNFQNLMDGTGRDKPGYKKIYVCEKGPGSMAYVTFGTELAEAINSMFRWYKDSAKCYAYLSDVSSNDYGQANPSSQSWLLAFQKSRWFTRGWTLQELIAPPSVQFFCSNGKLLRHKESLQQQLHEITGIETSAFRGEYLSEFSVDQRMSWARNRETKREEDKAYSLLGIFNIYMPLIYGEGANNAFRRLQEEIEKRPDKHPRDELSTVSTATFNSIKRSKTSHHQSPVTSCHYPNFPALDPLFPSQYSIDNIDATTKQSIVDQLYFTKIDERLTSLTAAQGKTCRWFLAKSKYTTWNDVTKKQYHGGFLWIKGNPGTEKSTLMKLLFQEAKLNAKSNASQITLSFFFLARGTVEEKTTTGLHRSLLHQLFEKAVELKDSLEWMTADGARGIERNGWNEEAMKQTLMHAVPKLKDQALMIFVDALDECDQNQARAMVCVFEDLCETAESSQVRLQICFSSRHYPNIVIQKGLEMTLEDESGHMEDIKHYIKSKLRLGKLKQAEALRSEILEKSSSIFLCIVLVLDILNSEYPLSINKMRARLNQIPPGLTDFSSKGLAEVTRNKASEVQFIHESVRDFLLGKYESQWSETSGHFVGNGHKSVTSYIIKFLVEKGAGINSKDMNGRTPLSWAASEGNIVAVKTLLEKGADINSRDEAFQTPLSLALS